MQNQLAVVVRDLSFQNDRRPTLEGLSFTIERGSIFGFLGPSGAGKSTTQNILTGLLRGYTGDVEVLGAALDQVSSFSNSDTFLSLLAPGQWISSSIPGSGFQNFQGTSMAAPHVTGAWAVLKQRSPGASVSTVLGALQSTGLPVTDARNGATP
jgi:ABC-type cobalamin/Fe3+-siderophores transport system ATPase subunit